MGQESNAGLSWTPLWALAMRFSFSVAQAEALPGSPVRTGTLDTWRTKCSWKSSAVMPSFLFDSRWTRSYYFRHKQRWEYLSESWIWPTLSQSFCEVNYLINPALPWGSLSLLTWNTRRKKCKHARVVTGCYALCWFADNKMLMAVSSLVVRWTAAWCKK